MSTVSGIYTAAVFVDFSFIWRTLSTPTESNQSVGRAAATRGQSEGDTAGRAIQQRGVDSVLRLTCPVWGGGSGHTLVMLWFFAARLNS